MSATSDESRPSSQIGQNEEKDDRPESESEKATESPDDVATDDATTAAKESTDGGETPHRSQRSTEGTNDRAGSTEEPTSFSGSSTRSQTPRSQAAQRKPQRSAEAARKTISPTHSAASSSSGHRGRVRKRTRSGPPSPTPEERIQMESNFVLDSVALSMRANAEPHRTSPSMNIGIPQYNAQYDGHAMQYFESKPVPKTLQRTGEVRGGSSMAGIVFDSLVAGSHSIDELRIRNEQGAGYNYKESVCGHNLPVADPFDGFNGPNGYRRNTYSLRMAPSVFGFQGRPMQPKSSSLKTGNLYTSN